MRTVFIGTGKYKRRGINRSGTISGGWFLFTRPLLSRFAKKTNICVTLRDVASYVRDFLRQGLKNGTETVFTENIRTSLLRLRDHECIMLIMKTAV